MQRGGSFLSTAALIAVTACGGEQGNLQIRSTPVPVSAVAKPVPLRVAEARGQLALGNVALALESFRTAAREQPDSIDALAGMAGCYDLMGRFDLSRRYYESALAVAPGNQGLLAGLASSLDQQGRTDEAAAVRREISVRMAAAAAQSANLLPANVLPATTMAKVQAVAILPAPAPARSVTIRLPPAGPATSATLPAPKTVQAAPVVAPAVPAPAVPAQRIAVAAPAPRPVPAPQVATAAPAPRPAPAPQVAIVAPAARPAPAPQVAIVVPAARPAPAPQVAIVAPVPRPAPAPQVAIVAPAARPAPAPQVAIAAPAARPAPAPQVAIAAPAPRPVPAPQVTIAAPAAQPAPAPQVAIVAPAPLPAPAKQAAIAVRAPLRESAVAAKAGARLERLSLGEVALLTSPLPQWRAQLVNRSVHSTTIRYVPLRMAQVRMPGVRLLNAARHQGLAARTRSYLTDRGWRQIAIGDADQVRDRSIILYPRARRATAQRLAAQFGFAIARRASGTDVVMLLGRDAAKNARRRALG